MAVVQKSKTNGLKFYLAADDFPRSILPISARAIRIDIVFGVYNLLLIQNPERIRRSTYPLQFTIIIRSQTVCQWQSLLSDSKNGSLTILLTNE